MKRLIKIALLAAVPIEIGNVMLAAVLLDPGPADTSWSGKLLAFQWVVLHFFGMRSLDWFTRVTGSATVGILIVFLSGYLETALFLGAFFGGVRWIVHQTGELRSRQKAQLDLN